MASGSKKIKLVDKDDGCDVTKAINDINENVTKLIYSDLVNLVGILVKFAWEPDIIAMISDHLKTHQQAGVGVPGGLESIIHAVNQLVAKEADEQWMLLQLDLVNAFNVCDRDSAFQAVEEEFPDILKWVLTCYSSASFLVFGDSIIMSECGFHQGDPLVSLLFSLTLHPIIEKINSDVPGLSLNEWYLDDGTVAGKKEQLQQVVDILLEHGPARGLHLSTAATVSPPGRAKSTVWLPNSDTTQTDPLA